MSYHTIILVGNLGSDPEMRYTPSGQAVTNFSLACNRQYTRDGEPVKETTWFRVSAWGKQAETCAQYLKKGRSVLIEGRLNADPKTGGPRIWEGQNGPGASFEITANTVKFLGGGGRDDDSGETEQRSAEQDEIPF